MQKDRIDAEKEQYGQKTPPDPESFLPDGLRELIFGAEPMEAGVIADAALNSPTPRRGRTPQGGPPQAPSRSVWKEALSVAGAWSRDREETPRQRWETMLSVAQAVIEYDEMMRFYGQFGNSDPPMSKDAALTLLSEGRAIGCGPVDELVNAMLSAVTRCDAELLAKLRPVLPLLKEVWREFDQGGRARNTALVRGGPLLQRKRVRDLQIGDRMLCDDGTSRVVTALEFSSEPDTIRVVFSDRTNELLPTARRFDLV